MRDLKQARFKAQGAQLQALGSAQFVSTSISIEAACLGSTAANEYTNVYIYICLKQLYMCMYHNMLH